MGIENPINSAESNPLRPGPLEQGYLRWQGDPTLEKEITGVAKNMVTHGANFELDFIMEKYPYLFADWMNANEQVRALVEEFSKSPRMLALALQKKYPGLAYETVYRTYKQSPIRPYVGDVTTTPGKFPTEFIYPSDELSPIANLKGDEDLTEIRINFYTQESLKEFSLNPDQFLLSLSRRILSESDQTIKQVWQNVFEFYQKVYNLEFPALVPQLLDNSGQPRKDKVGHEIKFPAPHQKIAIVKAYEEGALGVFDGTGSGKTAIGIGLAELTGAKRVLVVCPKNVRRDWNNKIEEYYVDKQSVLLLNPRNASSLLKDPNQETRYVIANYDLLISHKTNGGNGTKVDNDVEADNQEESLILSPTAKALLEQGNFDLLIVDEGHYINNDNKRSEAVLTASSKVARKIVLTATPIRNHVDDLSRILHILAPDVFLTPDAFSKLGPQAAQTLVDILAKKTIRRRTEDILGLPPFCPENNGEILFKQTELNPTQRAVYEAIFDDPILNMFTKIKLLRQAAIDHHLVMGEKYSFPFDTKEGIRILEKAFKRWQRLLESGQKVSFDSDFLVTHGYRHLFFGAHFKSKNGMNEFIEQHARSEIKEKWEGVVESSKFQDMKKLVAERINKGEKVIVFSGHFTKGILREVIDDVTGEKIITDLYTFLQKEFPDIVIGRIDGQVPGDEGEGKKSKISKREEERRRWQNDPNYKILLTNIPTSSLGIDLTVNDGIHEGVSIIGIDLPYTWADFWQMVSRVYRFGQIKPVNVFVMEAEDSIDIGIKRLILRKKDISEQMLDGILPNEIEKEIIDGSKTSKFLKEYIESPKARWVKLLNGMVGEGELKNIQYLNETLRDGKTVGQLLAELYIKYSEYSSPGHTIRLIRQVLDGLQKQLGNNFTDTADLGSGPLALQRVVSQESDYLNSMKIISVDLNKYMLDFGAAELEALGYFVDRNLLIAKPMTETGIRDESCDAVTCSLAFDCLKSSEERAEAVVEANRILRRGGYYMLTIRDKYLTKEEYKRFCKSVEKFGFKIDKPLSGLAKATDHKDNPFSVWILVAQKIGNPTSGNLKMDDFKFSFEDSKISSINEEREDNKSQYQEKLIKHEQFAISDPDSELQIAESLDRILKRIGLGITEEDIKRRGWKIEVRNRKGESEITIRNN